MFSESQNTEERCDVTCQGRKKILDDNKSKNGGTENKNKLIRANQQPSRFLLHFLAIVAQLAVELIKAWVYTCERARG